MEKSRGLLAAGGKVEMSMGRATNHWLAAELPGSAARRPRRVSELFAHVAPVGQVPAATMPDHGLPCRLRLGARRPQQQSPEQKSHGKSAVHGQRAVQGEARGTNGRVQANGAICRRWACCAGAARGKLMPGEAVMRPLLHRFGPAGDCLEAGAACRQRARQPWRCQPWQRRSTLRARAAGFGRQPAKSLGCQFAVPHRWSMRGYTG